jgi:hypothetical protein
MQKRETPRAAAHGRRRLVFFQRYTGIVNDREFRRRIADILERQEAEAQLKKPAATEKPKKAKKTRSA